MDTDGWHRVDPADVPAEGRVRSVTAMTSLFAADGPAMLHVEQDPELL
jgi:hypothetical protein